MIPPKGFLVLVNSILLGTGASPPESGNSILDTNTIKREVAFMGGIPCGRNPASTDN